MKTDLLETSIIIHYRKDSDDRAFNLKTIYSFLEENIQYKELIIINDNKEIDTEMEWFKQKRSNLIPLFFENDGHFRKAYAFNIAANHASGKVLCFYDVDVIIDQNNLKLAQDMILSGEFDHVYPFNGTFMNVRKPAFPAFLENFDFSLLKNSLDIEFASDTSPGGCNLISREAFTKIKGYDSDFIGWGFEDTDYYERSTRSNRVAYLKNDDAICWHLDHDNSIRLENPHYQNNLKKFIQNNRNLC